MLRMHQRHGLAGSARAAAAAASALLAIFGDAALARAQQPGGFQPPPPPQFQASGQGPFIPPPPPPPPSRQRTASDGEIATLYGLSAAYGVGMGIWVSAEAGIEDPGVFLIPPAVLGIAAPVGVFFLNQPRMPRGMPAAISAGMLIGATEGVGIASYQFVTADDEDAWGFRGLSRSVAIGSTVGAVAGYAVGYYLEPPPESSALVTSGGLWGTAIGAMFGYGASEAGVGYGLANDSAGLGGLIGFNAGVIATGALAMAVEPSFEQLAWMWSGAGIGAAISLPVFLFYAGEDTPPAKRGFVFMGTATTLGIIAGGVFSAGFGGGSGSVPGLSNERFIAIHQIGPMPVEGGLGVSIAGQIF